MRRLDVNRARELCAEAFAAVGLPPEQAEPCTNAILFASRRGLDSHGIVSILPAIANRVARGEIDRAASVETVRDDAATALLKGNGVAGPAIGERAMGLAIEKAKTYGVGIVGAFNCDHFGAASYYSSLAVRAGLIGLTMCNAAPTVAPFGGRKPVHGTNPISYGFPGGAEGPIILDIATSAAAHGQIFKAHRRGQPIPLGWAIDAEGKPTTDTAAALKGVLLPFGGQKGYGMGILVDALTGALAGSTVALSVVHSGDPKTRGQSFFFEAIDVDRFTPKGTFQERLDQIVRDVRSVPPAEGFQEVLLPGDLERRQEEERARLGIPLYDEDWQALVDGLKRAGVPADQVERYAPAEAAPGG
ncbi:MAG: Ldh family oxidoreductase [Chloroflexota bacterium]